MSELWSQAASQDSAVRSGKGENEMATSINGLTPKLNVADMRAAVRERLLEIVGLLSGKSIEASGATDDARASGSGGLNVILLDEGIDELSVQQLIATLRENHHELLVAFHGGDRKWKDLPCEFGSGRLYEDRCGESPIARAAGPYWRAMERASAVTRETRKICTRNVATPLRRG